MTALVLALLLAAAPALAQSHECGERGAVGERLRQRYGEVVVSYGIAANGALLELFRAPGKSWTIVVTPPGQLTCMIASGKDWSDTTPGERCAGDCR